VTEGFFDIPWFACRTLALAVTVVFSAVWSKEKVERAERAAGDTTERRSIVLRWFHALVWVLLAVSCFVVGEDVLGEKARLTCSL
jgi:hypothetical protein